MEIVSNSWREYPKVYALGHRETFGIFDDSVLIQEKIDGSQFSFGLFNGVVRVRSKNQQINTEVPEPMFLPAVTEVIALHASRGLTPGWTYRGEFVSKPQHHTLKYARVPAHNIILFDINDGQESYLAPLEVLKEADRLGLEMVPTFAYHKIYSMDNLKEYLDKESILGGTKVEGVVIKNYNKFNRSGFVTMAKVVREEFKEVAKEKWRQDNPLSGDIIATLIKQYGTEPRWKKAVQHLAEAGMLKHDPTDIGMLIKAIPDDIKEECEEEMKEAIWSWAWPKIRRGVIRGVPQWYKDQIAQDVFK